ALRGGGMRPPVVISLQAAFAGRRARHLVIYEGYAVTDKDFVLDRNTFADESVARDFAASPDAGSFLNLDEGADSAFIANFAAVQIYEMIDDDVVTQFDIRRDYTELPRHYSD